MIVVDSNVLAARNLTSVLTAKAEQVERKDPLWVVPVLWRYEFQNILATAIKANKITPELALDVWQRVVDVMSDNEADPPVGRVIQLIAQHHITAYDAQFIALALEMGVFCVTEDLELREKFPVVAVSMDGFLERSSGGAIREPGTRYRRRR